MTRFYHYITRYSALHSVLLAVLIAAGISVPSPGFGQTGIPTDEQIAGYFETIVFGREYDKATPASGVISKWSGNIGINIQGRVTPALAAMASNHLNTLSKLTGLRFNQTKPGDPGQSISLIFLKRAEMGAINGPGIDQDLVKHLAAAGGCYFMAFHKPPKRIVKAIIVINTERPAEVTNSCLLEEITQSLGLPNDSNLLRPSIFSDRDRITKLSRTDEILVRTLYDPRLSAGLSQPAAMPVVSAIIRELNQRLP